MIKINYLDESWLREI